MRIELKQFTHLQVAYHAKSTFSCLLYINMCPRCVGSGSLFETGLKQRGLWDATMYDLFGVSIQTLQRHVLYISETYNILMINSIKGDL